MRNCVIGGVREVESHCCRVWIFLQPQPQANTRGELCPLRCAFLLLPEAAPFSAPLPSLPVPFITCHLVVTGLILLGLELTSLTSVIWISICVCCDAGKLGLAYKPDGHYLFILEPFGLFC